MKKYRTKLIIAIFTLLVITAGILGGYSYYKITRADQSVSEDKEASLIEVLYSLMSDKQEKAYLLLLQNNTELRPTGGFIGNYGILKIKSGRIVDLYIDDIYNLDWPAEKILEIIPPEPMQKYFNREKWFLRDINWSPDFSITAHRAWTMYLLETKVGIEAGPSLSKNEAEAGEQIHGVIAINPELVNDFLDLTDGIEVKGVNYTRDNFIDTLQYEMEIGYKQKGIAKSERKDIINDIAQALRPKLKSKALSNPFAFLNIIKENIREKNILVYMTNEKLQRQFSVLNLTGELKKTEGDYLMVIDANLGSLKTDPVVARIIKYNVQNIDGKLVARVDIMYNHTAEVKNWKTSHYRTYTRVYVPEGARLIDSVGAMIDDTQALGEIDVFNELNKTVFGSFISINPGESKTLSFTYELPENISLKDYELFLQKQSGNDYTDYEVEVGDEKWQGILDEDKVIGIKK